MLHHLPAADATAVLAEAAAWSMLMPEQPRFCVRYDRPEDARDARVFRCVSDLRAAAVAAFRNAGDR